MTLTECKNHMRIYLNTADELGINWKRAAARWSLRYKWENERADNLQEKLDAANARAERVETAMVAMKERAERAEAALVECASSSLRLREELADVYRRAERAEAALKRAQRRAPPVGWRALASIYAHPGVVLDADADAVGEFLDQYADEWAGGFGLRQIEEKQLERQAEDYARSLAVSVPSDNDLLSAGGEAGNE